MLKCLEKITTYMLLKREIIKRFLQNACHSKIVEKKSVNNVVLDIYNKYLVILLLKGNDIYNEN